jgi:hypothetical protein
MKDYAEVYLNLVKAVKDVHKYALAKDHVNAYLRSCDATELAQELEDVMQSEANKVKQ